MKKKKKKKLHEKRLATLNQKESVPFHPLIAIRVFVGSIFILSGFIKLVEPLPNFIAIIDSFEFISHELGKKGAHVLPWVELVLGVHLVAGLWLRPVLISLWFMLSGFIGIVVAALVRKLPITDCGCFGEVFSLSLEALVVMDGLLWTGFAVMFFRFAQSSRWSLDARYQKT